MNKILLANLIISSSFFVLALLFKLFQPKKRNGLYGYRTSTSLQSDELWREANKFSSGILLKFASIVLLLSVGLSLLFPVSKISVVFTGALILLASFLILILTEKHLKNVKKIHS